MPDQQKTKLVHCADCGYFGRRFTDASEGTEVLQAGPTERRSGNLSHYSYLRGNSTATDIVCFRHAFPLQSEAIEGGGQSNRTVEGTLDVLNRERLCGEWYPYTIGRTPKEHFEEFKMQELEERRKDFELRLFNMSQKVQEDSAKIARDSKALARDNKIIAIIIGIIVIGLMFWQTFRPITVHVVVDQPSSAQGVTPQATATPTDSPK
jgi:hypothetical protein